LLLLLSFAHAASHCKSNYTKDQMNYSRAYWFNFLPFYHMGFRVKYQVNSKLGLNYWLVNGHKPDGANERLQGRNARIRGELKQADHVDDELLLWPGESRRNPND